MTRPGWDEVWMEVAQAIAQRSRCDRRQVGVVVVDASNRPISVGYNGPPSGMELEGTCGSWCPRAVLGGDVPKDYNGCMTVHAEMNALMFADRREYVGGTIYVTSSCCWECGKAVANSGVSTVVMLLDEDRDKHRDPRKTIDMMESCGVTVVVLNDERKDDASR